MHHQRMITPRDLCTEQHLRLLNKTKNTLIAEDLQLAFNHWSRLKGLLGAPEPESLTALILRPCSAVHTLFMRYSLDVIFVDHDGVIVGIEKDLKPWRFSSIYRHAYLTVEGSVGMIRKSESEVGDQLEFELK